MKHETHGPQAKVKQVVWDFEPVNGFTKLSIMQRPGVGFAIMYEFMAAHGLQSRTQFLGSLIGAWEYIRNRDRYDEEETWFDTYEEATEVMLGWNAGGMSEAMRELGPSGRMYVRLVRDAEQFRDRIFQHLGDMVTGGDPSLALLTNEVLLGNVLNRRSLTVPGYNERMDREKVLSIIADWRLQSLRDVLREPEKYGVHSTKMFASTLELLEKKVGP